MYKGMKLVPSPHEGVLLKQLKEIFPNEGINTLFLFPLFLFFSSLLLWSLVLIPSLPSFLFFLCTSLFFHDKCRNVQQCAKSIKHQIPAHECLRRIGCVDSESQDRVWVSGTYICIIIIIIIIIIILSKL